MLSQVGSLQSVALKGGADTISSKLVSEMQICSAAIRCGPQLAAAPCRAQQQQGEQQQRGQHTQHLAATRVQQQQRRRQVLGGLTAAAALAAFGGSRPASATGLESFDLPPLEMPQLVADIKKRNQKVLDEAEESFQSSGECLWAGGAPMLAPASVVAATAADGRRCVACSRCSNPTHWDP